MAVNIFKGTPQVKVMVHLGPFWVFVKDEKLEVQVHILHVAFITAPFLIS